MADPNPFTISLSPGKLRSKPKDTSPESVAKSDEAAEKHGFVERTPKKRRGRKPSPRTGQVHAKVMPNVSREISREASARGVQQGVLIEEAWALYKAHRDGSE
ncbi:hypothetical protein [Sulfitobacter geojensis]|uniref:hypothetical protein n=1 Tax=Sulfitobacter geojensis TaxID=1342299 RepID=UPI0007D95413|nr:hypothetical protein [Sulfitobacter geojensis]OAN95444.1 chromosome partitioning protein ParB [Sulfitobacter geojensis]